VALAAERAALALGRTDGIGSVATLDFGAGSSTARAATIGTSSMRSGD